MAAVFSELIDLIPSITQENYGNWIIDRENDGSEEHPIQMPYVSYSAPIENFIDTLYRFCESHPEYEHTKYHDTLAGYGIEWNDQSMETADVSHMDAKGIIALLIGAVRAERFCDGALLQILNSGSILRWLERLAAIDKE